MSKVSKELVLEWKGSLVTIALKEKCNQELERIRCESLSDNLCRGNPQITQERLVENTTKELEWETFIEILDGDWSVLEIEDDSDEVEDEVEE